MAFDNVPRWFRGGQRRLALPGRENVVIREDLAGLLDRAATETQWLTWETLQQYARGAGVPLEMLVVLAWGRRFPFVELVAAGMPQGVLAPYERDWARCSPAEQTRRLEKAFAYAATVRGRPHGVNEG